MRNVIIATLLNTTIIAILGIGIHALFHDWFFGADVAGAVYRPGGPLRSFVVPGSLLMGFAIASSYRSPSTSSSWVDGGMRHTVPVFAFAFGLGVLVPYGSSVFGSVGWVVGEGLFVLAYSVLTALTTAFVRRRSTS